MVEVTILHTCDMHGHLTSARAAELARLRRERGNCILLDGGDALHIGNLNPGWGSGKTILRMNDAGYTAMAMGNRESHLWWPVLRKKLAGIRFPVVSANAIRPSAPVQPWIVLETPAGIRVGVFGLTPVMVGAKGLAGRIASVTFRDPMPAAQDAVTQLRHTVDLLVCICHLGTTMDRRLAREIPGIDAIIGAHDHSAGLPRGERVDSTLVARSSPYAQDVGEITAKSNDGRWRLTARLLSLPR